MDESREVRSHTMLPITTYGPIFDPPPQQKTVKNRCLWGPGPSPLDSDRNFLQIPGIQTPRSRL